MEGYTTEQEQVEALKRWWQKNGKSVLFGIVVGLLALAGGRYWMESQSAKQEQASVLFESVMSALEEEDFQGVLERGGTVLSQYSDTPYASLVAFALARVKHEDGDLDAAQTYLRWVLTNSDDPSVTHVARLRLATILWSQDQSEVALELLDGVDPGSFVARYEELRGDILVSIGKHNEARQAYTVAMSAPGPGGDRNILQMKIDDLGFVDGQ